MVQDVYSILVISCSIKRSGTADTIIEERGDAAPGSAIPGALKGLHYGAELFFSHQCRNGR